MSESLLERLKRPIRKGTMYVALTAVVAGAAGCDAEAVRTVISQAKGEQNLSGQELTDRYKAAVQAKAIGKALTETGVYKDACVYPGMDFEVLPKFRGKYGGLEQIYQPVALDGNAVGYFSYNEDHTEIAAHAIDGDHGLLVQAEDAVGSGGRFGCTKFDLAMIDGNDTRLVATASGMPTYVGQGGVATNPNS